jgi:hypothetical protein
LDLENKQLGVFKMTITQMVLASFVSLILILFTYRHTGFQNIKQCYGMWFTKEYWTNYNKVEFLSWFTKAIIIIPGLIFGVQIWWLFFLTLFTSLTLIWASNKKLLPTLVGFNTMWVWLSCMVLIKNLI